MEEQDEIRRIIQGLQKGEVLLYPTDTVWGLGCDPNNEEAVQKVLALKGYEKSRPLILLVSDPAQLNRYVRVIPEVAWDLVEETVDPLTVIYPEGYHLAESVKAEDGSVGIRVVEKGFCGRLLRKYRKPLVSTSANQKGEKPPGELMDVPEEIREGVDRVVPSALANDEDMTGVPSSVIKLGKKGEVEVIRK